jgi:ABC-type polar amino acid transport system ATPase subunit
LLDDLQKQIGFVFQDFNRFDSLGMLHFSSWDEPITSLSVQKNDEILKSSFGRVTIRGTGKIMGERGPMTEDTDGAQSSVIVVR